MGNPKSNVSFLILSREGIPEEKINLYIALMQPWRFKDYKVVKIPEGDLFDDYINLSPDKTYGIIDTFKELSESILSRYRSIFPVLVHFRNEEEANNALESVNPKEKYSWKRFPEPYEKSIELNSAGDARFSPLFMKLEKTYSLESFYQLCCKGWKYAGYSEWKEVKGFPPLEIIGVDNFTRESVELDKDYIYLFTDNLLRTSGKNEITDGWYKKRFSPYKKIFYPTMTQAVIRGLENAFPITTMKDCYKTQLDDSMLYEMKRIWGMEMELIRSALRSGEYKGIKFSRQQVFGQGKYSHLTPSLQQELNFKLKSIGIDNENCKSMTVNPEIAMKIAYKRYFRKNLNMLYELAVLGKDNVFTERFATTNNTQVRYYCEILNEYYNL